MFTSQSPAIFEIHVNLYINVPYLSTGLVSTQSVQEIDTNSKELDSSEWWAGLVCLLLSTPIRRYLPPLFVHFWADLTVWQGQLN